MRHRKIFRIIESRAQFAWYIFQYLNKIIDILFFHASTMLQKAYTETNDKFASHACVKNLAKFYTLSNLFVFVNWHFIQCILRFSMTCVTRVISCSDIAGDVSLAKIWYEAIACRILASFNILISIDCFVVNVVSMSFQRNRLRHVSRFGYLEV